MTTISASAKLARRVQMRDKTSPICETEIRHPDDAPEEGPHLIQYFKADGRDPLGGAEIMITGVEISVSPSRRRRGWQHNHRRLGRTQLQG